jgi:hypothetical protein
VRGGKLSAAFYRERQSLKKDAALKPSHKKERRPNGRHSKTFEFVLT